MLVRVNYIWCSFFFFFLSCVERQSKENEILIDTMVVVELSKLEHLLHMRTDSVMEYYDLSHDSLTVMPDLSEYIIKSLDLSYNHIDTLPVSRLPKGLKSLNISHNALRGFLNIIREAETSLAIPILHTIDISNNFLTEVRLAMPSLKRVNISNNNIRYFEAGMTNYFYDYINMSNNPRLSNVALFKPSQVDTIIHDGIRNDEPLIYYFDVPLIIP